MLGLGFWSLAVIIGTLIFGRWFCGFVCPLGTLIDLGDNLFLRRQKSPARGFRNGKYLLLIFLIIAAGFGLSLGPLLDPLMIVNRTLTLVIFPLAAHFLALFSALPDVVFTEYLLTLGLIALIIGLSRIAPRFWCRGVCPLGGLLGCLAKFSLFRYSFQADCRHCGRCAAVCPTGAIDQSTQMIDAGECILCLRCGAECSDISYQRRRPVIAYDLSRRQVLLTVAAGLITAPLLGTRLNHRQNGQLIRPPGSLPETEFIRACIRCGLCLKICPTNGLQPCLTEAGLTGIWTPRLEARIGGCEKNCHACGQVCPSGAIRRLSLLEKSYAKMGTAVIDRHRCIAWEQDKTCLICDEACPYNAIVSRVDPSSGSDLLRPFVDEFQCIGCGICEQRCPIEGAAAIQVYSIAEERRRTGSFLTPEKIRRRTNPEKVEDLPTGFIIE